MTIHKSQGSQFDTAAVLLPDPTSRILTRELLYTAATRARKLLMLVGTEEAIRAAVTRPVARASGLGWRMWERGGNSTRASGRDVYRPQRAGARAVWDAMPVGSLGRQMPTLGSTLNDVLPRHDHGRAVRLKMHTREELTGQRRQPVGGVDWIELSTEVIVAPWLRISQGCEIGLSEHSPGPLSAKDPNRTMRPPFGPVQEHHFCCEFASPELHGAATIPGTHVVKPVAPNPVPVLR